MSDYCLTINIKAASRHLLDDLVVTLESINDDMSGIKGIDIFIAEDDNLSVARLVPEDLREGKCLNEALFLDTWMVNQEQGFSEVFSY